MRIEFSGEIALITGAASGIGLATAQALKACGARIAGADRDRRGIDAAAACGAIDLALALDVTDPAAVDAALARCDAELGPVSVLVTAAGILQRPLPPDRLPASEWDKVIATNLTGSWTTARAAGSRMAARGRGAVVFVSSILGTQPGPVHGYSAAKAGIEALTRSLAAEWGPKGVRVNAVAPGFAETPLLEKATHFGALDPAQLAASAPLGRLATPQEIATAIAFLASPLASGITGVSLAVDAGFLAGAGFRAFPGRG